MPRYRVVGMDRDTGVKRVETILARDRRQAIHRADMVVESIEQLRSSGLFASAWFWLGLVGGLVVGILLIAAVFINGFASAVGHASAPVGAAAPSGATDQQDDAFEILSVDTRVMERNSSWWKYAWVLELKNNTDRPIAVDATIQWLDEDGFVLDDDQAYNLLLNAGETRKFQDYDLLDQQVASRVHSVQALARRD